MTQAIIIHIKSDKVKALLLIKLCNKWLRLLDTKYKVRIPSRSFEISRLENKGTQVSGKKRSGLRQERKEADIGTGERSEGWAAGCHGPQPVAWLCARCASGSLDSKAAPVLGHLFYYIHQMTVYF